MAKNPPVTQETWVRSLGQDDPLEKEMAIHSSTLAWKIPWMEEPDRPPWGHKESDTTERLHFHFTYGSAYVSTILSQFVPHFISPALSTSLLSMSASLNSFLIFIGWYNNHYNQFWNTQFILKRNPISFCSHFPFILNPYKPKQPLVYFPTT